MTSLLRQRVRATASEVAEPSATGKHISRIMLVDDSLTVRTVFKRMISREDDLKVVAEASSAEQALSKLRALQVDVILLDLEMPGRGGLEALPELIEASGGAQILVVSSLTEQGAEASLTALAIGAAETLLKPLPGGFNDDYRSTMLAAIRALSAKSTLSQASASPIAENAAQFTEQAMQPKVVAIGASTGGIHALNLFLRALPSSFSLPILITQHLPDNFIPVFARQIELTAVRETVLAGEGIEVRPNRIIIAPGHGHMQIRKIGTRFLTSLSPHVEASGCKPSVDPMFASCAEAYSGQMAAILLSGMGRDGTLGASQVAKAGGVVLAQDQESSAVWGMPRSASETGLAQLTASPEVLAQHLTRMASGRSPK
jgi:two-component system chemotaxis response regulator CheB